MRLILGGTAEAHGLASALTDDFTVSLAGATRNPPARNYPTRSGGFGGVDGLCTYIDTHNITAIVDATHPFAANISRNATQAAATCNIPLLRLTRPAWIQPEGSNWMNVSTVDQAANALPTGARAFLSVGRNSTADLKHRTDVWFLSRGIEPAKTALNGTEILQRPPFTLAGEIALMQTHAITHLITKNAGGAQTRAKIDAAAYLNLPAIVIERPRLPLAETVETIEDALKWIRHQAAPKGI